MFTKKNQYIFLSRRMLSFIAGCALSFQSMPAWSLTLREAAELAVKTYPEVRAAEEFGKALDQKVRQAYAGYLPKVDFSGGYGPERSDNATTRAVNKAQARDQHDLTMNRGEASLIVRQNLFDGYDVRFRVAQAKAQLQAAKARTELTSDSVALRALLAYVDVVMKYIQLELIKDNVLLHQRIMSRVQQKSEGGVGTEADVKQAKSRTYLASANHANNQAAYNNAQAKFSEIVGRPSLQEQEMVRPVAPEKWLPKTMEEALESALRSNPELETARMNVAVAEAGLENTKATLFPKLDLELTGTNNANVGGAAGHGQTLTSMLRVSYNIFDGGAGVSKIQEQRNMLEQAQQNMEKTQRALEETIRETWNKLVASQTRTDFMRMHYEISKEVTASYHDQFKAGKRTLLDVLNSENELFAAKNGLLFEELTYIKNAYELFARMGTLREVLADEPAASHNLKIRIEEDVERNDPTQMDLENDAPPGNDSRPVKEAVEEQAKITDGRSNQPKGTQKTGKPTEQQESAQISEMLYENKKPAITSTVPTEITASKGGREPDSKQAATHQSNGKFLSNSERGPINQVSKQAVREIRIVSFVADNTAFFPDETKILTDRYIGRPISPGEIQALQDELLTLYANKGLIPASPFRVNPPNKDGIMVVFIPEFQRKKSLRTE